MDYTERFLKRKGQDATITSRTPAAASKAFVDPASRTGFRVADRDSYWDGMILSDAALQPGELVSVGGKTILVMSTDADPVSGQTKFMGAKANISLTWQRHTVSTDANNNVVITWPTVSAGIPAFGQLVTAYLRQEDPGLLPSTKYLLHVPASYNIAVMDRVVFNAVSCQVDALDDIILKGIIRLQVSEDTRI